MYTHNYTYSVFYIGLFLTYVKTPHTKIQIDNSIVYKSYTINE